MSGSQINEQTGAIITALKCYRVKRLGPLGGLWVEIDLQGEEVLHSEYTPEGEELLLGNAYLEPSKGKEQGS